jgi:hypothetical protein
MHRELSAPSLGAQIVPVTAASVGVAFLLLLMPASDRNYSEIALAAGLGGALVVLSSAWHRAPRLVELGVPIG